MKSGSCHDSQGDYCQAGMWTQCCQILFFSTQTRNGIVVPHLAMSTVNSNLLWSILSELKKVYLKQSITGCVSFPVVIWGFEADSVHLYPFTLPISGHTANLYLPDNVLWPPKTVFGRVARWTYQRTDPLWVQPSSRQWWGPGVQIPPGWD